MESSGTNKQGGRGTQYPPFSACTLHKQITEPTFGVNTLSSALVCNRHTQLGNNLIAQPQRNGLITPQDIHATLDQP